MSYPLGSQVSLAGLWLVSQNSCVWLCSHQITQSPKTRSQLRNATTSIWLSKTLLSCFEVWRDFTYTKSPILISWSHLFLFSFSSLSSLFLRACDKACVRACVKSSISTDVPVRKSYSLRYTNVNGGTPSMLCSVILYPKQALCKHSDQNWCVV